MVSIGFEDQAGISEVGKRIHHVRTTCIKDYGWRLTGSMGPQSAETDGNTLTSYCHGARSWRDQRQTRPATPITYSFVEMTPQLMDVMHETIVK